LEHAFPDFNINHQCKNFDQVLEWQGKNAVDEQAFVGFAFGVALEEIVPIL
jgi:hypothetical protein